MERLEIEIQDNYGIISDEPLKSAQCARKSAISTDYVVIYKIATLEVVLQKVLKLLIKRLVVGKLLIS